MDHDGIVQMHEDARIDDRNERQHIAGEHDTETNPDCWKCQEAETDD